MNYKLLLTHQSKIKKAILQINILRTYRLDAKMCQNMTTKNFNKQLENNQKFQNNQLKKIQNSFLILVPNSHYLTQIRSVLRGGPGYTKFGHGRYKLKISRFAYFWYAFLVGSIGFVLFFDFESLFLRGQEPSMKMKEFKQIYDRNWVPKAKEISSSSGAGNFSAELKSESEFVNDSDIDEQNHEHTNLSKTKKKDKLTFRNRKIIEYENRLRKYSTPDKIFRYFASLTIWNNKTEEYEAYMTPEDFVRSLIYDVKQPEGLGLDRYNRFDPQMQKLEKSHSGDDCVFNRLSPHGVISFSDFLFLYTLLSTPTRHFEIAFYMFDLDGNGNIDLAEFEQLQAIIRNQTTSGKRHRDTRMTGSVIKDNPTLNEYFFGKNLNELLTVEKFVKFQRQLQSEVIKMEFDLCDLKTRVEDNVKIMSELTFCEMILAYAGFKAAKTKKMLKNISRIYNSENAKGITLSDYEDFFQVLRSIQDIDTALKFYAIAGASIDKSILKHVAKTVAGVDLSDHVIEVIFNLFDENGDGKLSHKEFIKVMKKRWMRGLQMPKDTGFVNFVAALAQCTREMII